MNEKTIIIMKILSIAACMGISWVRFFLLGKETILYNQLHTPVAAFAVLLLTGSYKMTSMCFIYILYFTYANGQLILNEYTASPEDFQKTLEYLLNNYRQYIVLIWIIISMIVYQRQALVAQLWAREKEREELLCQVRKKNEELEKMSQAKTKFLLSLSHEFRNPINAALGNLELANENTQDPGIQKCLMNCKVSIEMLFHLVSNLLDSTKIEAGILELNPLRKDSRALFYKVWGIVKNLMDKQDLIGEFYIHKNIPQMLNIDSHFVVKILLNLILNAIKYTHGGAVMTVITWVDDTRLSEPMFQPSQIFYSKFLATFTGKNKVFPLLLKSVTTHETQNTSIIHHTTVSDLLPEGDLEIPFEHNNDLDVPSFPRLISQPSKKLIDTFQSVTKDYEKLANKQKMMSSSTHNPLNHERRIPNSRGFLKIEVFDSGCGMDDEVVKNNIFQKFSSLAPGTTEDRLGLGLGLWLTKKLCESIGGQVKAFSEKNKGSQFVAIIPAECSEPVQSSEVLKFTSSRYSNNPVLKLNAMVVDDDRYNREINGLFLGHAGVKVDAEAINGQEAVEMFMSKPEDYFDLIMMDLEMPIMNGKEAVKRIRQFENANRRSPVKVIIATGNCDLKEYTECMDRNGEIKADFFYRKPLVKKDFEEFVELLQREKVEKSKGKRRY